MKKIFFLAFVFVFFTANAQDDQLPEKIEQAFMNKYVGSKIDNWTINKELFYIEFYIKGDMYTSVFNEEGQWKETSEVISDTDIPTPLKEFIKRNYPKGEISYSEKVERENTASYFRINYSINENFIIIKSDINGNNIKVLENDDTF